MRSRRQAEGQGKFAPVLALALLLLCGANLQAQDVGAVLGSVVNEATGMPLEGAQVSLVGTQIGAVTSAEGRFLLQNVTPGEHQLRVDRIGMGSRRVSVTVPAGGTVSVTVRMSEVALQRRTGVQTPVSCN
jgi:hypothetical protein